MACPVELPYRQRVTFGSPILPDPTGMFMGMAPQYNPLVGYERTLYIQDPSLAGVVIEQTIRNG